MSAIKNAYETLRTWELLDWYADEQAGNWAPQEKTAQAYAVRDYYQTIAQKELGIQAAQFAEFVEWHFGNVMEMDDEETDMHTGNGWALEAQAMFNYYSQAMKFDQVAA